MYLNYIVMENLRDWAWELIGKPDLLDEFKTGIFRIIWYKEWKNEARLVDYLTTYRMYNEQILTKGKRAANDSNYKQDKKAA